MISSLRLLLEDFLGLMREEGELDAFLPLLMSAMGHEVFYRAYKGVKQYGVDILSVGPGDKGVPTLHMWLVKHGNIGRSDWSSGQNSIRQSMEDVGDTYLRTHVAPQHAKLPKKLLLVTNGDFHPALNLTMATYEKAWQRRHRAKVEEINGSRLASWTETFLMDEHVLAPDQRALFRRMLSNVSSPELCVGSGRQLVNELMKQVECKDGSTGARKKRSLQALRGIRTALSVLTVWAHHEGNLAAPYQLAEYALLRVWAGTQDDIADSNSDTPIETAALMQQFGEIAVRYHLKLRPYYVVHNAFAIAYPDSLLVSARTFSELGRLSLQGLMWAFFAAEGRSPVAEEYVGFYSKCVAALLQTHECSQSPPYDHNSTDIHTVLLFLLATCEVELAKTYVASIAGRLGFVQSSNRFAPLTASFDDALTLRREGGDADDEFLRISTLLPILLIWAAVLDLNDVYDHLRLNVLQKMSKSSLNLWSSDNGFDRIVADPMALQRHGIGEVLETIDEDPVQFLRRMHQLASGVEPIEDAVWYGARLPTIPLLAALHWRLQIPRLMLVKHACVLAGKASATYEYLPDKPDVELAPINSDV